MADTTTTTVTIQEPGAVTRQIEENLLRSTGLTLDISEAEPGFTGHLAPGDRLVFHKAPTEPTHITSVTVALGCTLSLAISGGTADDPDAVAVTLRADGGTAIGVPTVAVPELRAAGLVI